MSTATILATATVLTSASLHGLAAWYYTHDPEFPDWILVATSLTVLASVVYLSNTLTLQL